MTRTASFVLTCLALASCAPAGGDGGAGSGDVRLRAACTQAADRVYDAQHRADIYAPMSGVNSPQSGNYSEGLNGRGLSQLFDRDNDIDDCVRRSGVTTNPAIPTPPPPAH